MDRIDAYLEIGRKRTFAGALEWPGWCRSGHDESGALGALLAYEPRYRGAIAGAGLGFAAPPDVNIFNIVERLPGNATTDFGAPGIAPDYDAQAPDAAGFERFLALLQALWQAFDRAVAAAAGRELSKGPRGGGRAVDGIVSHVIAADAAYLSSLGWKYNYDESRPLDEGQHRLRQAIQDGMAAAQRGELPLLSPRGKRYWSLRYFVRRSAWHVLDHAWEIEDRII